MPCKNNDEWKKFKIFCMFAMVVLFINQLSVAMAEAKISEEQLVKCYEDHPFFLKTLMMLSDTDYENPSLSAERKLTIKKQFEEKPDSIRSCREAIVQFAKEQNDPENLKYVIYRLKEVTTIIYSGSYNSSSRPPVKPTRKSVVK